MGLDRRAPEITHQGRSDLVWIHQDQVFVL